MEFKHSSDFDDCHYIHVNNKCYSLGFFQNEEGIFPRDLVEISSKVLPLELQVEWGFITQAERMIIEMKEAKDFQEKLEKSKEKIEKDKEFAKYLELKKKYEK